MTRKADPGTRDRLEQLLDAALAEFASKSYGEASLNAVLKQAGISKGVFYHYFADKLALYRALLQQLAEMKLKVLTERTAGNVMPAPGENLFAYFQRMLTLNAYIAAHNPRLYRFAVRFAREPAAFRLEMQGRVGTDDVTAALVEHGLRSDTFDPAFPPEAVRAIFTYFVEHVFDLLPLAEDITPEAVEERMALLFRFLQHGLGRHSTPAQSQWEPATFVPR